MKKGDKYKYSKEQQTNKKRVGENDLARESPACQGIFFKIHNFLSSLPTSQILNYTGNIIIYME